MRTEDVLTTRSAPPLHPLGPFLICPLTGTVQNASSCSVGALPTNCIHVHDCLLSFIAYR